MFGLNGLNNGINGINGIDENKKNRIDLYKYNENSYENYIEINKII